ncbi:NDR1/HIN1-like protein 10 [Nymphaea colorata]|uniref:NDR1/HIN1-like protein 10 n=1 Tax=Nymphaea colorata TaxID=210225 RepID=UPI00129E0E37|nr:NDR1/HIN1-like protein 10 [Nymphaea colorata]
MAGYGMPAAGYPPQCSHPSAACSPPPYYPPYPPPQPDQTYYYGAAAGGNRHRTFFQCLILCATTIFVVLSIISFIFWIVFRPQLPDFSVTDVTVSGFNFSGNELSANWDVNVTAFNGNKKLRVNYDFNKAAIYYEGEVLAVTSLPPFYQDTQTTTTIPVHLATASTFLSDFTSNQLKSSRSNGEASFDIQLRFGLQFKSRKWTTRWRTLRILCENVEIDWTTSGSNPAVGRLKSAGRCLAYH